MYAIGDEELLDYVIERDFEDTVSRAILVAVEDMERIGKVKLTRLLRGLGISEWRTREHVEKHYGRLRQLNSYQILDFEESLIRLGLLDVELGHTLSLTTSGKRALGGREPIRAQIPWPFPVKPLPGRNE